jgi:hypothetical protein
LAICTTCLSNWGQLKKLYFKQFLNFNFLYNFCLHAEVKITGCGVLYMFVMPKYDTAT